MRAIDFVLLIKPFAALAFFGLIVLPIAMLIRRLLPEGRVKDILFNTKW